MLILVSLIDVEKCQIFRIFTASYLNLQKFLAGKGFVAQYYALFDDVNQRNSLVNMYNVSIDEIL